MRNCSFAKKKFALHKSFLLFLCFSNVGWKIPFLWQHIELLMTQIIFCYKFELKSTMLFLQFSKVQHWLNEEGYTDPDSCLVGKDDVIIIFDAWKISFMTPPFK